MSAIHDTETRPKATKMSTILVLGELSI